MRKVGEFEGVRVFESSLLGHGNGSAGLALPGLGIIVGDRVYSDRCDMNTVKHEFGHILQARKIGILSFYIFVGFPSLLSAWLNWHGRGHDQYWTELWCNHLVRQYFQIMGWNEDRFPAKDISTNTKYWLVKL